MVATHRDTTPVATTETRFVARAGEETKPSLKTTELAVLVAAVAGVLLAARQAANFDADWAWTLVAALAIGYMLSRGLAKAGSRHTDGD